MTMWRYDVCQMAERLLSGSVSVTSTGHQEVDAVKKFLATAMTVMALSTLTATTNWPGWPCNSYHGDCQGPRPR